MDSLTFCYAARYAAYTRAQCECGFKGFNFRYSYATALNDFRNCYLLLDKILDSQITVLDSGSARRRPVPIDVVRRVVTCCRAKASSRFRSARKRVYCRPSTPVTRRTRTDVAATMRRTAAIRAAARTASTCSTRAAPVATVRRSRRSTTSTRPEVLRSSCIKLPVCRPATSSTLHTTDRLFQWPSNSSPWTPFCLVIMLFFVGLGLLPGASTPNQRM